MKFFTSLKNRLMRKQREARCDLPAMDGKLKNIDDRQHKVRNRSVVLEFEAYGGPRPTKPR